MAQVLVLSSAPDPEQVLPALGLLAAHRIRFLPADVARLVDAPDADVLVVDGAHDLLGARTMCALLRSAGHDTPILLVVTEGGLSAVSSDWGVTDVVLPQAGPAEVEARLRLAGTRAPAPTATASAPASALAIDDQSYSAKLHGRPLDLTFKEFQLLHFLAAHPGRVFTREQLLSEVWGYDYFGGTRTVDVHVRRLRAKLGEHDQIIGTVRNVGYRFAEPDDTID